MVDSLAISNGWNMYQLIGNSRHCSLNNPSFCSQMMYFSLVQKGILQELRQPAAVCPSFWSYKVSSNVKSHFEKMNRVTLHFIKWRTIQEQNLVTVVVHWAAVPWNSAVKQCHMWPGYNARHWSVYFLGKKAMPGLASLMFQVGWFLYLPLMQVYPLIQRQFYL